MVVEEGVSIPKSVTWQQTVNLTAQRPAPRCCAGTLAAGSPFAMMESIRLYGPGCYWIENRPAAPKDIARGACHGTGAGHKALEIRAEVALEPRRSFWVWAKWASAIQRPPLRSWLCCWAQIRRPLPDGAAASQSQLFKEKVIRASIA